MLTVENVGDLNIGNGKVLFSKLIFTILRDLMFDYWEFFHGSHHESLLFG